MYYKIISNGRVIDTLNALVFVKRHKEGHFILCGEDDSELILNSSNDGYYNLDIQPYVEGYTPVSIKKIDEFEYEELRKFDGMTKQELIDATILNLIEEGVI